MNRNRILLILGVLFSIGGLLYTFQDVEFWQVLTAVQNLRSGPFWVSQGFFLASLVLRAVRWQYLLLKLKQVAIMSVFSAIVVGMFANNILPARIGEFVRAAFLGRREQTSSTSILANIVLERIADLVSLLGLFSVYLLFLGAESEHRVLLEKAGWVLLAGSIGVSGCLFLIIRFQTKVNGLIVVLLGPWSVTLCQRLESGIKSFSCGLDFFQGWPHLLFIFGLSIGVWLSGVASFFYLLESFSIQLHFLEVLLVFCIVVMGIAIPSAPGFVGTFHAFTVAALSMVGIKDANLAAAYATVLHGMSWLIVNLLGVYFVFREGKHVWSFLKK